MPTPVSRGQARDWVRDLLISAGLRSPMISVREFLTATESAAERASLDAHRAVATVSASILQELRRARRLRWMPLAWISPWMRRYLDTFIDKLEHELNRREIRRQAASRHGSRSTRESGSEQS